MESMEERTAGGFLFCTEQDAQLAAQEQRKIEYLQARMHYSNPEGILRIYEKAVAEKIFQTPVGIGFLKELQGFLQKKRCDRRWQDSADSHSGGSKGRTAGAGGSVRARGAERG